MKRASLFASNGLVYSLNALYYCFIQIYITKFHPDDTAGILLAIGPLVAIFAPIFWGMLADRARSKNLVLAASVLGSAVFYCLLGVSQSFIWLAAMLFLTMLFMSPFGGLVDIITLEYTTENKVAYGPIRICGTIAFGALPMILTPFTDSNINLIFVVYPIAAVLAAVSVMLAPRVEGHASEEKKSEMLPLFRDKRLMLIFLFVGVAQFTWAYYLNYYPAHLETGLGLSQSVWGVNVFVTAISELPFFLAFTPLFEKLGLKKLLGISLALCTLRYAALAMLTSVPLIYLFGFITGSATTIFTYCGSVYITRHVAPESKASANSLMYALGNGVPKVLAGVIGGKLTVALGCTSVMWICAALCLMTIAVFALARKTLKFE